MDETVVMVAQATAFLLALWAAGFLVEKLQLPALVGEIIIGIAMGPGGFNAVPDWHGFLLLGKIGIFWLLFDGGAHLELDRLRDTGLVSLLIALTGVAVPMLLIQGAMMLVGFSALQSFVIGTALAPTSGGMAVKLMSDAGVLQSEVGQIILCSAMTDDVFSLVILAVVSHLNSKDHGEGDGAAWEVVQKVCLPVVSSLFFMMLAWLLQKPMTKLMSGRSASIVGPVMCCFCTAMTLACKACVASEYMGAFLAGVVFSSVAIDPEDEPGHAREDIGSELTLNEAPRVKKPELVPEWLEKRSPAVLEGFFVSIFFASSGFNVPVNAVFEGSTMALGLFCSVVAAVGKLVAGAWRPSHFWCIGWAMVGRGELGFVMATQALKLGLTDDRAFNVTIWAVLTNTLISPPIFRRLAGKLTQKRTQTSQS